MGLIIFCLAFSKTPLFLAYHDLLIGKAYHYNKEMALRFEIIRNSKEKKIILRNIKNIMVRNLVRFFFNRKFSTAKQIYNQMLADKDKIIASGKSVPNVMWRV